MANGACLVKGKRMANAGAYFNGENSEAMQIGAMRLTFQDGAFQGRLRCPWNIKANEQRAWTTLRASV